MLLRELIAKTVANAAGPGSVRILRIDIQRGQAELLFDSWQLVNPSSPTDDPLAPPAHDNNSPREEEWCEPNSLFSAGPIFALSPLFFD